jgi:hypothetical protein
VTVKLSRLEVPAGDETETVTDSGVRLAAMVTVAVIRVPVTFTLLTVIPADGENCTLVTVERLVPVIERDTVFPAGKLLGVASVIWGSVLAEKIVKVSVLETTADDETATFTWPPGVLAAIVTVAVTCVAVAFTLLTVIPVDGENCTAVTPERLEPEIVRDTLVPADPLVGLRDVIWGGVCRIVGTEVKVPSGLNRNPIPSSAPPEGFWNRTVPLFPVVSGSPVGITNEVWPLPARVIVGAPSRAPLVSQIVAVRLACAVDRLAKATPVT